MREKHRIFKCDQCNFTSSSEVGLKIHKTKSHPLIDLPEIETEKEALPIQIKCDQCDLYFKDESGLKTHFGYVHCDFYDFVSKSKQGLKDHKTKTHTKTIDTQYEYTCPICDYSTYNWDDIQMKERNSIII